MVLTRKEMFIVSLFFGIRSWLKLPVLRERLIPSDMMASIGED